MGAYIVMIDEIKIIYEENIQWLNFAELKNGALMTACIAILAVVSQLNIYFYLKCVLMIFSALVSIVCMTSFIPFLNQNEWIKKLAKKKFKRKNQSSLKDNNIIFYVNIFLSDKDDYKKALIEIVNNGKDYTFNRLENNYISQLMKISTIASIKYYIFNVAVKIFFAFSLFLVASIMIA